MSQRPWCTLGLTHVPSCAFAGASLPCRRALRGGAATRSVIYMVATVTGRHFTSRAFGQDRDSLGIEKIKRTDSLKIGPKLTKQIRKNTRERHIQARLQNLQSPSKLTKNSTSCGAPRARSGAGSSAPRSDFDHCATQREQTVRAARKMQVTAYNLRSGRRPHGTRRPSHGPRKSTQIATAQGNRLCPNATPRPHGPRKSTLPRCIATPTRHKEIDPPKMYLPKSSKKH